ncbi:hypothetical protein LOAG_04791 [Loa loa]|uniref:Uncharacterized protein n=1 Tax=Loa loa TaxID=7209 RepID=A0A1S0U331_LOALO|nr:hypothetical protein LOAG_04791 [Loa loa]EFO23696.1 hypothetical protein LOAG_04791 [Loa loa]
MSNDVARLEQNSKYKEVVEVFQLRLTSFYLQSAVEVQYHQATNYFSGKNGVASFGFNKQRKQQNRKAELAQGTDILFLEGEEDRRQGKVLSDALNCPNCLEVEEKQMDEANLALRGTNTS